MVRRDTNENRRMRGPRAESRVEKTFRRAVENVAAIFAPRERRSQQSARRSA